LKPVFTTKLATRTYAPTFNEKAYNERTQRNHFWLGGLEGQSNLKNLKVGIAGLGGMGSNLAEIMVRLGVGHIKIADPDTIDFSNINRQVIANRNTVGVKKTRASASELRNIAEDYELVVYEDGITEANVEEFVSDLDLIIDEIDVFPLQAHVWLHQAARKKNLPLYSGYIIGMGTHVYKFQGSQYTFEDFMLNDKKQIEKPTLEFLVDRFINPAPAYMNNPDTIEAFCDSAKKTSVPIFGATTYLSQSLIAVRIISDQLQLHKKLGGAPTPLMPQFISLDPLTLTLQICEVDKGKIRKVG
jgi:molybdopterin/thiamine biosynthesis adenylyltransferase